MVIGAPSTMPQPRRVTVRSMLEPGVLSVGLRVAAGADGLDREIAHPRIQDDVPAISAALFAIGGDAAGREILDALGLPGGFEPMSQEDAEFMIDLMDTLLD